MQPMYSEVSHVMNARPEQINAILSEYRAGHHALDPLSYCIDFMLENSDNGVGNIVHVQMNFSGIEHEMYERVVTPVPLRLIMEYDANMDVVVVIIVEPTASAYKTRVTISTINAASPNFAGFIENLFIPKNLRQLYDKELRHLTKYIRTDNDVPQAG
jgi:hypothetical protein